MPSSKSRHLCRWKDRQLIHIHVRTLQAQPLSPQAYPAHLRGQDHSLLFRMWNNSVYECFYKSHSWRTNRESSPSSLYGIDFIILRSILFVLAAGKRLENTSTVSTPSKDAPAHSRSAMDAAG